MFAVDFCTAVSPPRETIMKDPYVSPDDAELDPATAAKYRKDRKEDDKPSIDLSGFTGTENWYTHWTGRILYTDGVKHLADNAGAHWLIDAIASYQGGLLDISMRTRTASKTLDEHCGGFQVWTLTKNISGGAILDCRQDSGEQAVVVQHIEFTDFPFDKLGDEFQLWVEGIGDPPKDGTIGGRVLLLPSEH